MSEELEEEKCNCPTIPGWITTFSDLMSLLLAFFVLLFSFSEMDKALYKQVGGSLREAFGVQREIKAKDPLTGIKMIATEFSPGRPDPTTLNEIRQETTNTLLRYLLAMDAEEGDEETTESKKQVNKILQQLLENLDKMLNKAADKSAEEQVKQNTKEVLKALANQIELSDTADSKQSEFAGGLIQGESTGGGEGDIEYGAEEVMRKLQEFFEIREVFDTANNPETQNSITEEQLAEAFKKAIEDNKELSKNTVEVAQEVLAEFLKASKKEKREQNEFGIAEEMVKEALKKELAMGIIELKSNKAKKEITLQIKEKSSFPSGSAELLPYFVPVIKKMTTVISKMYGTINVSGHTDNIPIHSSRFRSNWELSAARAVSVVHAMLGYSKIPEKRFQVEGHADTRPISSNKTVEGRAKNRRVEVSIRQARLTAAALNSIRASNLEFQDDSEDESKRDLSGAALKQPNRKDASKNNSQAPASPNTVKKPEISVDELAKKSESELERFSIEKNYTQKNLHTRDPGEIKRHFKIFDVFE